MSLLLKLPVPLASISILGLCTGLVLDPSIPRTISNCLIPVKDFICSCWNFFRSGEPSPLNNNNIIPGTGITGNQSRSFDRFDPGRLIFDLFGHKIVWYLLSPPLGIYEIQDIENLPFSAEVTQDILGDKLRLSLNPQVISNVSHELVEETVKGGFYHQRPYAYKLSSIFQLGPLKLRNPSKETISYVLFGVFAPISGYFGLTCEPDRKLPIESSPLSWSTSPTYGSIVPDYCIRDESQSVVCVVNIKSPSFFGRMSNDFNMKNELCYGNMAKLMTELQICMMAACSRFGILSDGYFLILVEFRSDWPYYHNYMHRVPGRPRSYIVTLLPGEKVIIPYETLILNVHSTRPSFLEGLAYFLNRAKKHGSFAQPHPHPLYMYLNLVSQPTNMPDLEAISEMSG